LRQSIGSQLVAISIETIGQQATVGQTGNLVHSATMRAGMETIRGLLPAIPYKVVPP